jgi:hypothetical protein
MELSPAVAELLSTLEADPQTASVTFFPFGLHTHLMSDGMGGWNLEVHTSVPVDSEEPEEVISDEEHLSTEELVFRMSSLASLAEAWMDQMVADAGQDFDAELEALLNDQQ